MTKERILITVKTYPTLSKTYGETVCTAGIREDGSWVRLYPVPFRRLEETEQYSKYDWIELELVRHTRDPRPESYRPRDPKNMPGNARVPWFLHLWRKITEHTPGTGSRTRL